MSIGLGVMISNLGDDGSDDGNTATAWKTVVGRKILEAKLDGDVLRLMVEGDANGASRYTVELYDDGQLCCERRYLVCDDNLAEHIGATLTGIEERGVRNDDSDGDCHEMVFIAVKTSVGEFVLSAHNEHNGYYSGFALRMRMVKS